MGVQRKENDCAEFAIDLVIELLTERDMLQPLLAQIPDNINDYGDYL